MIVEEDSVNQKLIWIFNYYIEYLYFKFIILSVIKLENKYITTWFKEIMFGKQ